MENEVFGAANAIPCELLVTMPTALDHAIQDVTHRLVDRVLCELEKGESICSLQTVEQNQFSGLNSIEIRRTVKITRLVRCRECRWGPICMIGQHLGLDGFCSKGEREVQE